MQHLFKWVCPDQGDARAGPDLRFWCSSLGISLQEALQSWGHPLYESNHDVKCSLSGCCGTQSRKANDPKRTGLCVAVSLWQSTLHSRRFDRAGEARAALELLLILQLIWTIRSSPASWHGRS